MAITEQDRKLGLEIANQMQRVYVKRGYTRSNIAEYIAKGISLGLQQGRELAALRVELAAGQMRACGLASKRRLKPTPSQNMAYLLTPQDGAQVKAEE